MTVFNLEMEQYTPPPQSQFGIESVSPTPPNSFDIGMSEYTPPVNYESDFNIDLAQYTPPSDNPTGAIGGWLNAISNLIPSVQKGLNSFLGNKGSVGSPLSQTTQALNSTKSSGGVVPQAQSSSGVLGYSSAKQSSPMIWLIIGGIALFILFFVRK